MPDISFFAANGYWGHFLLVCDSSAPSTSCSSSATFGGGGGTSFTAPQFAGVTALLVTLTGQRQGTLNPALYALGKAQFTSAATKNACYSNGQTSNTGVTTSLPASSCIFNDVTTSSNDEPCAAGSLNCYVNPGANFGILSTTNAASLTVAYPSGPQYDEATGLGSINIANLLNNWSSAFTSTTSLSANPTSIASSASTSLTATVTGAPPTGYTGTPPALTGSVNFLAGTTNVGSCVLSGGTCSVTVNGSQLQSGANSMTAVFVGSATYPSSTSSPVTVTVTTTKTSQTITFGALPNVTYGISPFTLTATASSGLPVTYTVSGPASISGSTLSVTGAGNVTVTASQAGNATYAAATPVSQGFSVAQAILTVTAKSLSKTQGSANPALTYAITGFVNGDTSSAVSGSATLSTTATTTSPAGKYPITFSTEALSAVNYSFNYVSGTLTVTAAADTTPPTVSLFALVNGPPKQVLLSSQDNAGGSGLASVVVSRCTNCTASTAGFTKGTSSAVITTATKTNQSLSSSIQVIATDVAGNSITYDPVDFTIETEGRPTEHTIEISALEHIVLISNGNPGISTIRFRVDGRLTPRIILQDGENTSIDIGAYMKRKGRNRVTIIANGVDNATSWIVFTQK